MGEGSRRDDISSSWQEAWASAVEHREGFGCPGLAQDLKEMGCSALSVK